MNTTTQAAHAQPATHELRFDALFQEGRALSFPCDESGHVCLDDMSERARTNYFFARTVIGRDFQTPTVRPLVVH